MARQMHSQRSLRQSLPVTPAGSWRYPMQWQGRERSSNVEDRRGLSTGAVVGGGGGLILVLLALVLGVDPRQFMGNRGGGDGEPSPTSPAEDQTAHFAKVVFHDTEVVWEDQFRRMGKQYANPTLVLFRGQTDTGCG